MSEETPKNAQIPEDDRVNISFYTMRKTIGILGMTLPFMLIIGNCFNVLPSISHFYYSDVAVVFIGVLFTFGLFLFSYRVPRSDFDRDNLLTNIAGVLAILVALVPTGLDSCESCGLAPNAHHADVFKNSVHLGSAFLFFVIMAIMSYFFFTKGISKEEERLTDRTKLPLAKQRKISRNRVYRICGIIMGVLLLVLIIWFLLVKAEVVAKKDANNVVFWIETGLLLAFGFSWLVKGKALQFTGLAMFTDPNKPKT